VPLSGSLSTLTVTAQRYQARYSLRVMPEYAPGQSAYAEVTVPVNCPDAWAFPVLNYKIGVWNCPASPPKTVTGAAERFERGAMYWLSGVNVILVRSGDQQEYTGNVWTEALPAYDPWLTPPPGLHQPVRGFGWVWRGQTPLGDLRSRLGWAVEPEYAQSFTYQCNSAPDVRSEFCYIQTPHGLQTWFALGWEQVQ
jgi:hypothetical protein